MAAPGGAGRGNPHGNKRKLKKKSLLSNARGYGKKKCYGRGTQLDEDTYNYYVRVMETLRSVEDNPEERAALVRNVLEETVEKELLHSSNQISSAIIEKCLILAEPPQLERFLNVFGGNLRVTFGDEFSSHVLETLISTVARIVIEHVKSDISERYPPAFLEKCSEWVIKVSHFALNNLEEYIFEHSPNFVTRTILSCLSGFPPDKKFHSTSKTIVETTNIEEAATKVPTGWHEILEEFYNAFILLHQLYELPYQNHTSALLQTLVAALNRSLPKLKNKLIKKLLHKSFINKDETNDQKEETKDQKREEKAVQLAPVFETDCSVRLLEVCIQCSTPKLWTQIYAMCFMNKLSILSCDKCTNFAVQRLINSCSDSSERQAILDELLPELEKIQISGKTGVLLELALSCKGTQSLESSFSQELMKALHCWEPKERRSLFAILVAKMITYEAHTSGTFEPSDVDISSDGVPKVYLNLHGCLILQAMLAYKKPIGIVNSLLELKTKELLNIFCNPKGSHILDAFSKSETIGIKSREKLAKSLKGSYVPLVTGKFGSRAFETFFASLGPKLKEDIMEELSKREALIMGLQYGRIVANKLGLDLFAHRRNEWKDVQEKKGRTKDLFSDIIGSS